MLAEAIPVYIIPVSVGLQQNCSNLLAIRLKIELGGGTGKTILLHRNADCVKSLSPMGTTNSKVFW